MNFPKHKAELSLTHNQHKSYYKTVEQAVIDEDFGMDDWINEKQKQKAISTNDCWVLQWYPDTPVGFCVLSAADLEELLKIANKG